MKSLVSLSVQVGWDIHIMKQTEAEMPSKLENVFDSDILTIKAYSDIKMSHKKWIKNMLLCSCSAKTCSVWPQKFDAVLQKPISTT